MRGQKLFWVLVWNLFFKLLKHGRAQKCHLQFEFSFTLTNIKRDQNFVKSKAMYESQTQGKQLTLVNLKLICCVRPRLLIFPIWFIPAFSWPLLKAAVLISTIWFCQHFSNRTKGQKSKRDLCILKYKNVRKFCTIIGPFNFILSWIFAEFWKVVYNLFVSSKKRNHEFTNSRILKCCKMSFKAF